MTATANIGMNLLTPSGSSGVIASKTSDQPQQPFIESLFAVSKAYSETDSANDGNTKTEHRPKSASEDKEAADADRSDNAVQSSILSRQTVQPQQVIPAQQTQTNTPESALLSLSFGQAATTSSASAEATVPLAGAAIQDSKAPGISRSETGNKVSGSHADEDQDPAPTAPPSDLSSSALTAATNSVLNTIPNRIQFEAAVSVLPLENSASTVTSQTVDQTISSTTRANPSLYAAYLNVSGGTANEPGSAIQQQSQLPGTVHDSVLSFDTTSAAKQPVASVNNGRDGSKDATSNTAEPKQPVQFPTDDAGLQTSAQQNSPVVDQSQSMTTWQQQSATLAQSDAVVDSATPVLPAQNTSVDAAASAAKTVLASTVRDSLSGQAIPARLATDQTLPATGFLASGGAANSFVPPIQAGSEMPGAVHANVSSINTTPVAKQSVVSVASGKDQSMDSNSSAADLKQHVQLAAGHAGSETPTQQDASTRDQSQGGSTSQQQGATLPQMNAATNSVVAVLPAQNASPAFTSQGASMHAGATSATAKLPDAAASATATQATPVINTAKLIQSIGQSEMRVGMRSNEFGNISISTTSSKDVISAQISLEHGELAKALAAQLPEMQARLGGNQSMDVRIDMNGASMGHGTGTSGSMSNDASGQSSANKQQSAYTASSYPDNGVVEGRLFPVAAARTTGNGSLNARLDIRV